MKYSEMCASISFLKYNFALALNVKLFYSKMEGENLISWGFLLVS